jgi:hypothetical protein
MDAAEANKARGPQRVVVHAVPPYSSEESHMKIRLGLLLASGLLLAGCSSGTSTTGADCEGGTSRVDVGTDYNGSITGGVFPNNCTEVCIWSPESTSLTIGVSGPGLDLDLDLYVDQSLDTLISTASSNTAGWESIAFGTGPEEVTITNPEGRYYAQVCSYDGSAASFVLSTSTSN